MEMEKCLYKKVSYQKDTWSKVSKEILINDVLTIIRSDLYKIRIEKIRNLLIDGDIESYKAEKMKLPAVTFCGTFNSERKKEKLKYYNFIIVIDIDKLSESEKAEIENYLEKDNYVFAFWTSPSGNGIKGLVSLKYNFEIDNIIDNAHKSAFEKLSIYFKNNYNIKLDNSGNDITRLCYLSYDEKIVVKNEKKDFILEKDDLNLFFEHTENFIKEGKIKNTNLKDALFNAKKNNKNKNVYRYEIRRIINFLSKKGIAIGGEYENRYKIGYAISNTFTYNIGLKYFLEICKIGNLKYKEVKYTNLLIYCYENNIGWTKFSLIENLAKSKGYRKNKFFGE